MSRAARDEVQAYVEEAGPRLLLTARSLTRDPHEAQDLFQDTMVKVFCKWSRVRASEQIDAYVRRMMVNTLLTGRAKASYRRERPNPDVSLVAAHVAVVPDAAESLPDEAYVLQVLSSLPAMQRAVLTLRFLEDMSDDEIARELDCSRSSVASAASRGLTALRGSITREQALTGSFGTRRLRAAV